MSVPAPYYPSRARNVLSLRRFVQIDRAVNPSPNLWPMGADQHYDWATTAASALDWWREAGVDTIVEDEPRDWLARTRPPAPAAPAAPAPPPVVQLPDTLDAFVAWRTGPDAPEAEWGNPLLPPEGDPACGLMMVVDMPGSAGLFDDAAGKLFDRMLAAIGRDRDSIYLVSLAVARPLGNRIAPEAADQLADLMKHHITLVAPKRLFLLGQAPSRAILGMDRTTLPQSLHSVNLESFNVEAVASHHPRFLLERPAAKADAWKDLQLLIGGLS